MINAVNGALVCARYAFAPNFYNYCGPDTQGEIGEYLEEEIIDQKLVEHLTNFEVMYPYLQAIAQANKIKDPLDYRVVEAYWVGNQLLERVTEQDVYLALTEKQRLPKRIPKKELKWLMPKIDRQARLHHSFHVLNVFTRTGHHTVAHTVETMNECRISWGEVIQSKIKNKNTKMKIKSQKLCYRRGKLLLEPTIREVNVPVEEWAQKLHSGDKVSVHWGFVCEKLTLVQVKTLERYTRHHLQLANATI